MSILERLYESRIPTILSVPETYNNLLEELGKGGTQYVSVQFKKRLSDLLVPHTFNFDSLAETAMKKVDANYTNTILRAKGRYSEALNDISKISADTDMDWLGHFDSISIRFDKSKKDLLYECGEYYQRNVDQVRSPITKLINPKLRGMKRAIKSKVKIVKVREELLTGIQSSYDQVLSERTDQYVSKVTDAAKLPNLEEELDKLDLEKALKEVIDLIKEAKENYKQKVAVAAEKAKEVINNTTIQYK
jgi:hypothetical protein